MCTPRYESTANVAAGAYAYEAQGFSTTAAVFTAGVRGQLSRGKRKGRPHAFLMGDSMSVQMKNNLRWALAPLSFTLSDIYWNLAQYLLFDDTRTGAANYRAIFMDIVVDLADPSDMVLVCVSLEYAAKSA